MCCRLPTLTFITHSQSCTCRLFLTYLLQRTPVLLAPSKRSSVWKCSLICAYSSIFSFTISLHCVVLYSLLFFCVIQVQPFNGLFSRTTWVSRYQKGKTNLDFTGARDSEWQCHHLGHIIQVCTSLQTDNHASTPPLCFFTGRMPFLPPKSYLLSHLLLLVFHHPLILSL